jgi:WD40 repeat protein
VYSRIVDHAFSIARPDGGALIIRMSHEHLAAQAAEPGVVLIRGFPLAAGRTVDLELERFWVTNAGTRFDLGGTGQRADFNPDSVILLRGRIAGEPRSHVYLATAAGMTNGVIELGAGLGAWGISSRSRSGSSLPEGELTVFAAAGAGGPSPIPFCLTVGDPAPWLPPVFDVEMRRGLRQVELAVETDNAFFRLFGDATATNTYLVQLYGAVSDIYMREINVRVDLTYVRIWPQANEPFAPSLSNFQDYWNSNMGAVPRDVAQMFSGRGDLPGGVAYLSALCGSGAYSFCGNAVGYFADPQSSSVLNYDPLVTAHELGHNCGSQHTDYYGLDNCNLVTATPQRGTIMSYCNQTVSGAMSVIDMGFHKVTRNAMLGYLPSAACIVFDCNQNGRSDALDIALGSSPDTNGNGIPDECEDCNHNGILDSLDISSGFSHDYNANGIPDECEPDCNANTIPDDRDILLGTSQDLHGDGIPDECDADLNNNGISDYNEIFANMTLDKDRNRVLDSKQDCDNDGTPDLVALQGANDGWVATLAAENTIREYHPVTGVLMSVGQAGAVAQGQDLVITPTRRVLVTSASTNNVVEFSRTGALVGTLVPAGSGGLANPAQMLLTPSGTLLVASRGNNSVLEYNLLTGAFVRAFVAPGSGGLSSPFGLTLGPSGNLFVSSSASNQVFEYNGTTGAFVRIMVTTAGNGGLSGARGLIFKPDGNLLVAGYNNDQVKEYNGATGAFIRDWLVTGLPIDGPWCLRKRPDGIYISRSIDLVDTHVTRARIFIHDPRSGNFVRAYVQAMDSGLSQPTGFDFMPGAPTDCNANQLPDNCDIAHGFSTDINNNGIPDECERTCYANCDLSTTPPILNVQDFSCFLNLFAAGSSYTNCDGSTVPPVLNVQDFACFLNRFAQGCP